MLNNILVYVNIGIVVYKFNVSYIVYMKHVSVLGRLNLSIPHVHYEQAKFFLYSLCWTYEHTMFINKLTTYMIIFGCLNVCLYDCIIQSCSQLIKTYARIFGEAKDCSYIYIVNKEIIYSVIINKTK